ncbi:MAG: hypothetical protein JWO86_880 [Myxococcaceae bacterium]|nr:hypothetical protein [Myxococcaceae bacterium]
MSRGRAFRVLVCSSFGAIGVVGIASVAGCGNPAYRAAERGDSAKLRSEIAGKHEQGKLSNGEAACLARAVATREVVSAKDDTAATSRIRESRACAAELDDALEERMKKHDGAGAEAALARLEDGRLSDGSARDFLADQDDRWRAVGTRTLHRDDDRKRRQEAFLDPSPRVRRSAIRAAGQAKDVADLDLLFESARVDPELLLRNEALRAMSQILRADNAKSRAAEHVNRLRDLWTTGDDAIREDIAVAWALSPVFESGGREALRVEIAGGRGPGAIAAAGVVLRTASKDAELTSSASALLIRTISEGSRRDRLHALAFARSSGPEIEAIRKVAKEEDLDVKVPALARLLDSKPDHDAALKELEAIAGQGVSTKNGPPSDDGHVREAAARARLALAQAGDLRIQAWIEQDLASTEPSRRLGAASALAALGRPARAVMLLTDPDASVRTRAACTMLVASRR